MMKKEEFFEMIEERVKTEFPEYELRRSEVTRSGNTVKTSLVVRDPHNDVAPSLRLDDYWEEYQHLENTESASSAEDRIVERIVKCITQAFQATGVNDIAKKAMDAISNWRSYVQCSLVIRDGNDRFLEDKPFMPFLDMAKVYYITVDNLVDGHVSRITITNDHMASMGCTLDEMDAAAMDNALKENPAEVRSMSEVLAEMMGLSEEEFTARYGAQELPMYVVSNQSKCDGASVIMFKSVLEQICDTMKTNAFYMLPSSRHECICIPAGLGRDVALLKNMVHEVNATQVPPEDLLSENVYYYERGQELRICEVEQNATDTCADEEAVVEIA
ncbi:MAG: hypothetical protein IJL03_07235 [Lachnospiraceae bacterium]|nr:hypothetical protein [Lachnospiraceae bacterium]